MIKITISIFLLMIICITSSYSQEIPKRVLLEEFSTAPCGFCPEGGIIAEQLIHKYPNLYTYTHHAGFGSDSMTIPESKTIAKYTTFAPAAVIDRGDYPCPPYTKENFIGISRQKWDSICAVRLNNPAKAEIVIEDIIFDEVTRKLAVTVITKFIDDMEDNDYRINFAIVEDSVSGIGSGWDQKNYFNNDPKYPDLYQKGEYIEGYQHRHVLRAMPTGNWGDATVIPAQPEKDVIYTYELTDYEIPELWKTKDITLYAFISVYNEDIFLHKIFNSDEKHLVEAPTGIEQTIHRNGFSIYPNPVTDLAYIECNFPEITNAKFELFSINGQKIRDIKKGNFKDNTYVYFYASDLTPGIYFIKISTSNSIICNSFVVH